jgi:pimeloyl-ACP methyl ester carboxylesterase
LQQLLHELSRALPILVIAGAADPLIESAGDAEVLVLDGTGHFPHLDRAADVAEAIDRFARRGEPSRVAV